jgi:hypothetical protein
LAQSLNIHWEFHIPYHPKLQVKLSVSITH